MTESKYFNLSPISDLDTPVYFEALKEKLNDDSVKNIAITGTYGSGKSSILESYISKDSKNRYLRISLANFCETNGDLKPEEEKKIEEHILQQLFYQLSNDTIPFSAFKKINHFKKRSQNILIIKIFMWAISLIYIPSIISLINQNIQDISALGFVDFMKQITWLGSTINILFLVIFCSGFYLLINELFCILQKGQLKKVVMKSAQIELSEDSALNKYIDEIIYFFEATDKTIVIMEDLDRFNSILLFSKLREVNFLINNSPKVKNVIKFVYAIRDDVFTDHFIRTKFFDFILPIVPVINTTNSGDKLREYLKNDKFIPESFINDVSLYIHDLRLLKNIVNEYNIYNGVINKENRKRNVAILSIIIYKNIFPNEFGLEHSQNGLLFKLFNELKKKLIEFLTNGYQLGDLIGSKNKISTVSNITEVKLRQEYIIEILKTYPFVVTICNETVGTMISNDNSFRSLLTNPQIQIYRSNYGNLQSQNIEFTTIQKNVNPKYTYIERLELLKQNKDGTIDKITNQIIGIQSKIEVLERIKLKEIIKLYPDNSWKSTLFGDKIKEPTYELLSLLVRKGYINENYHLHMSHFYVGALSLEDYEFLLNVKKGEGDNFSTELSKVSEIISRISDDEFEYEATLNKNLIYTLLKDKNYNQDKRLDLLLGQFKSMNNAFLKYIMPLIESLRVQPIELQRLLDLLVDKYFPSIWQAIEEQNYDELTKESLFRLFLFLPDEKIKLLNISCGNECLKKYLSSKENFIESFSSIEVAENIKKVIKALNIKFENIKFDRYENNDILNFIYENNYYVLNERMLYLILYYKLNYNPNEFRDLFYKRNYTVILESKLDPLINYILADFDNYIKDIYLTIESKQEESEYALESLIDLLEDGEENEILKNVLYKNTTQIKDITAFGHSEIWNLLLDANCIKPTWNNLLSLFKNNENELDDNLVNWLNKGVVYNIITLDKFNDQQYAEPDKESAIDLMVQIIENNKINDIAYSSLLLSFPFSTFENIALNKINAGKILQLIEYRKISFDPNHFELLKERGLYNELLLFTTNYLSFFINKYSTFTFSSELHIKLLESSDISIPNKKTLIKLIPIDKISDSSLSTTLGKILLSSNDQILEIERIIRVIMTCENLDLKLQLFRKFLNSLSLPEISKILNNLGGDYKAACELRKRPTWEKSKLNLEIAYKLKEIGYFKSVEEKKDEIKISVRYK